MMSNLPSPSERHLPGIRTILLPFILALLVFPVSALGVVAAPQLALGFALGSARPPADTERWDALKWRGIGPSPMGGRVVDLAVDPVRKSTYYVAAAGGGVWKTSNNGASFRPIFDDAGTGSIGALGIAPSRRQTLWVGTGEANPRNSVSWGDGVYVSHDGGDSFEAKGLAQSHHIGAIAVHPTESQQVFVAAMGHTWGPNPERGLYRSDDGGDSWRRVLFVDEHTGCIDVLIDPREPTVVYAAMWTRQRDEFDGGDPKITTGEGSGLYKSTDGGDTWRRLRNGLPTRPMGRIGLDLWQKNPDVLFAIVQTDRTGRGVPEGGDATGTPPRMGVRGEDLESGGYRISEVFAATGADEAGIEVDDRLLALDEHAIDGVKALRAAMAHYRAGDRCQVRVERAGQELQFSLTFGGRPVATDSFSRGMQGGQQANVHGAQGSLGFETGGVFRSDDRGEHWRRINSLNPRPFYYSQIRVDPADDSKLYVLGISLHRSVDGGARFDGSRHNAHPDHHALWIDPDDCEHLILGNDGGLYVSYDGARTWDHHDHLPIAQFYGVAIDMQHPYHVYGGLQDNGSWGGPTAAPWSRGVRGQDWIKFGGGDGFRCAVDPRDPAVVYTESQHGVISRWNLRENRSERVRARERDRFNWNAPFLLSPHNSDTLYFAGTQLYRSIDAGRHCESLSEGMRLTRGERGTATTICESPRTPGKLFVGSDDGALWRSDDAGGMWVRVSDRFEGVPGPYWLSGVVSSAHHEGLVYASLDGHRHDDPRPYLFRSEDDGAHWTAIVNGLPAGSVRCIEEDPLHRELIYAGTEFGCYASIDRGEHWLPLGSGLPPVAVYDLVVHPRQRELVAATHGRGVWILDVSALQQFGTEVLEQSAALFEVMPVTLWTPTPSVQSFSTPVRGFVAENPSAGAQIYFWLGEDQDEAVKFEVQDVLGRSLNHLEGPRERGLHRVRWDLRVRHGGEQPGDASQTGRLGRRATAGEYSLRWAIGDERFSRRIVLVDDPRHSISSGLGLPGGRR